MTPFDQDFIDFFTELASNNDRDWFHANKKRYENSVKKPFQQFVTEAIAIAQKLDKKIDPQPKDCIFRINRDIRFSKNKDPYKLHSSAVISPKGRKDMEYPGFYMQFGADKIWIGGGAYMLSKEQLQDMRYSLIDHPGELAGILAHKEFKKHYSELRGERYKVLPKEFKEAAEKEDLLFMKQFYYMAELPAETLLRNDLTELVQEHFKTALPLNQYLIKAFYQ